MKQISQLKYYKHTQIGWLVIIVLLASLSINIAFYSSEHLVRAIPIFTFTMFLLIINFATLTVEVIQQDLIVKFGPGIVHKRINLDEVESFHYIRNSFWNGWGIRIIRNGWLYNVSGYDSVQVVMKNGKAFRIGTDDVDGLLNVLAIGSE